MSDPALEMLFRASHDVPRIASRLIRTALREAHRREQGFVDEHVLEIAIEKMRLAITAAK